MTNSNTNSMWGGRFDSGPSGIMLEINASIGFDKRLFLQDIRASIAHAEMLGVVGILKKEEVDSLLIGLNQVEHEIKSGKMEWKPELEDIHMHVESRLKEIVGPVAGKLHTARSRNDQVATDFKLWVRDAIDGLQQELKILINTLLNKAEHNSGTIMPGYTHLQPAQPVTFGHHLLAYVEMFGRDISRLQGCRKRLNECPLGAAALAGTPFPVDRNNTALKLGFDAPTANSLDSVSDRDFALEYLSCLSIIAVHASRMAEEIVNWSNPGFGFIKLSGEFSTGSSIMPQRKNPDAAELARAKSGRIIGHLMGLLTVMKGLPLAYSKDVQEDKEPVFDATDSIVLVIKALAGMFSDLEVNESAMLTATRSGYLTATDLADWLVRVLGLPFRESHHITGAIVKMAEEKGLALQDLPLSAMQAVEPAITEDIFEVLSIEASVSSRKSFGGTAPEKVREAVKVAREKYL